MIVLFVVIAVVFSFSILLIDNMWLMWNATLLYSAQFLIYSLILLKKIKYFHSLFLPSNMLFFYLGLSFSIGSAVVPHNIGFLTVDFIESYRSINNFPFITFFWVNVFNLVFFISYQYLDKNEDVSFSLLNISKQRILFTFSLLLLLFFVSIFDVFFKFGFQLAIIALLVTRVFSFNFRLKVFFVLSIVLIILAFNSHNKREVLMAMMLIMLIFSVFYRYKFDIFSLKSIYYFLGVSLVFVMVIAASIIRGYGSFVLDSPLHAFLMIPDYFMLESFSHIIVDNFEFSHTFPAAVLSMEYALSANIDLQAGLTLIKPLFIIIPREVWSLKPDSYISIFTFYQAPHVHNLGGSFPVALPSELFANFHVFSIFIFGLIVYFFNLIFHRLVIAKRMEFTFISFAGLISLFFMLVRGSGFDLYFIHSLCLLFMSAFLKVDFKLKFKL